MKHTAIMVLGFLLSSLSLSAQETPYVLGDLSVGAGSGTYTIALSGSRHHSVIHEKIHLGYGLRFNYHGGNDQRTYLTAPYQYTQNETWDSASFETVSTMSLNLNIHAGYAVNDKLYLGWNIDVVGLTFGPSQQADVYYLYEGVETLADVEAKPTTLNLLLVGDNDIGTLNSEFFVRYLFNDKVGARLGFSAFFSEYTLQEVASEGNDRFRNKLGFPFAAFTYKL